MRKSKYLLTGYQLHKLTMCISLYVSMYIILCVRILHVNMYVILEYILNTKMKYIQDILTTCT